MAQFGDGPIDRYKAALWFFIRPVQPHPPAAGTPGSYVNQLYYELVGTTNNNNAFIIKTLDGSALESMSSRCPKHSGHSAGL